MEFRRLITVCQSCGARINTTNHPDGKTFQCAKCGADMVVARGVDMLNDLFARAASSNASDIHLEPLREGYRARFRVDGLLRDAGFYPKEIGEKAVSRAKLLASADIAEKRLHQDGSFQFDSAKTKLDVRMSSFVTVMGENLVMRLLNRKKQLMSLMDLKMPSSMMVNFIDYSLSSPAGIIIFTGPTGCGKTTTLYSCISHVRSDETKIITVEDPVEVVIDGISQCTINNSINRTYENSLKAIVRQDPDIILLGEIRDRMSAETAIEAAMTGHKVFSTLHTEDSVGALLRLVNLDIEAFLVASALNTIVAQRLVRLNCTACREKEHISSHVSSLLGMHDKAVNDVVVYKGKGCEACGGTGFKGRLPIFEILQLDPELRGAIIDKCSVSEIRRMIAKKPGFLNLREYGMLKVFQGLTTAEEVMRIAPPVSSMRSYEEIMETAR